MNIGIDIATGDSTHITINLIKENKIDIKRMIKLASAEMKSSIKPYGFTR